MTVRETDVPGVGRKFELELDGGVRAVVVLHHGGRVEVFRRATPDADSERVFDLTSQQANNLGSILEGAYFETVDTDDLSVPLGDAVIEWTEIPEHSYLAGETLRSAAVRDRTGASVIALQRGTETVPNPDPDVILRPGELLVTLGTREEQAAVAELVEAETDDRRE